jgi:hypothetical protein
MQGLRLGGCETMINIGSVIIATKSQSSWLETDMPTPNVPKGK